MGTTMKASIDSRPSTLMAAMEPGRRNNFRANGENSKSIFGSTQPGVRW
jgi:hypothetical protein